jgi:hypothetical protein
MVMKRNVVLWWIPAIAIALLAVAEGAMRVHPRHAAPAKRACATKELTMDVAGNGHAATVRLVRIGDDAWADVVVNGDLQSTTRVGAWRDDAALEAIDVNGDGRADLVRRYSDAGKRVAEVWLSDGTAFEQGWRGPSESIRVAVR